MTYGNIVLASTKSGFIPNGIKWITGSQFSHSFITTPDILGVPMCMEAAEGGVDFTRFDSGYSDNLDQGYEVWNVKIDQSVKDKALISVLSDLEMGYGFLEFPWFIWRKINLLFGRDIKGQNNWNTSGMICSQLCVSYLKACGLEYIFAEYGNGSVAPQDLQNIFKAHPEIFEKTQSVRLTA
jgi:hypothetical protein